jgi:hypothetical protein
MCVCGGGGDGEGGSGGGGARWLDVSRRASQSASQPFQSLAAPADLAPRRLLRTGRVSEGRALADWLWQRSQRLADLRRAGATAPRSTAADGSYDDGGVGGGGGGGGGGGFDFDADSDHPVPAADWWAAWGGADTAHSPPTASAAAPSSASRPLAVIGAGSSITRRCGGAGLRSSKLRAGALTSAASLRFFAAAAVGSVGRSVGRPAGRSVGLSQPGLAAGSGDDGDGRACVDRGHRRWRG